MSLLERSEGKLKEQELFGFEDLFSETFSLWSKNLLQIFITYIIPVIALEMLLGTLSDDKLVNNLTALIENKAPFVSIIGLVAFRYSLGLIILPIVMSLSSAALIYYFHNIITDNKKKWGESFNLAAPVFLKLALWVVIINLIVTIGLIVIIIPGIYLGIRYLSAKYVVVLERGVTNPLKRSWELSKGFGWRMVGYFVLLLLIYSVSAIPLCLLMFLFGNSIIMLILKKCGYICL